MPQKQYRTNFPIQLDAKVACWYGEKEGHMKVDDGISGAVWV